jgi:hypothetical protein
MRPVGPAADVSSSLASSRRPRLNQSHTFALAAGIIAAMFLLFALLVGRVPAGTGFVLAIAACSPAIMFAVERANMDVAIFSLVAVAILLWRAFPGAARFVSPLFVLLAATAKIYPVFALPAFLVTGSQIAARAALLCVAMFGVYLAVSLRDVLHVARIATQGELFSYGARILPAHLYHQVGADQWAGPAALKQLIAAVPLGVVTAMIAIRVQRHLALPREETNSASASLLALHTGALIYLGTFAIANNFDYRLVFLLLTLPQLVEWIRRPAHRLSSLASATLVAIIVLLWVGSLSEQLNLWDELASWAVAALLIGVVSRDCARAGVSSQDDHQRFSLRPSEQVIRDAAPHRACRERGVRLDTANGVQHVVYCLAHAQADTGASVAVFTRDDRAVHVLSGGAEPVSPHVRTVCPGSDKSFRGGSCHAISNQPWLKICWPGNPTSFTFTRFTFLRTSRWRHILPAPASRTV